MLSAIKLRRTCASRRAASPSLVGCRGDRQPAVSPDGRFRWNGERWVPTAYQRRRTCLLVIAILGGIFAVFLALFLIVLGPTILALFRAFT